MIIKKQAGWVAFNLVSRLFCLGMYAFQSVLSDNIRIPLSTDEIIDGVDVNADVLLHIPVVHYGSVDMREQTHP